MPLRKSFIFAALVVSAVLHGLLLLVTPWGLGVPASAEMPGRMHGGFRLTWTVMPERNLAESTPVRADTLAAAVRAGQGEAVTAADASSLVAGEAAVLRAPVALYLPPSQLSVVPRPLHDVATSPPGVSLSGMLGEAQIMLLVSEQGTVDAALVGASSLPDEMVTYALTQFRQARFSPGMLEGRAVKSRIRILLTPPNEAVEAGHPWSAKNRRKEAPL